MLTYYLKHSLSVMLFIAALAGCAQTQRDVGFADVQHNVTLRIERQIQWRTGSEADEQIDIAISRMLENDLTAEESVQIALLNNRRLQATYQQLGIAQAELVQSGLLRNPVFDAAVRFPISGGKPEVDLGIAQDFLDVLFIPMRKSIAEAEFEAEKWRVTEAVIAMAGQTQSFFYRAQRDYQSHEMWQQVVKATAASLYAAQRLHAAGNITDLALANEQAMHGQSRLNLATVEVAVRQSREQLNAIMGLWGNQTEWNMNERLPDIPGDVVIADDLESKSIANSIELAAAREDINALGRRAGLVKSAALFGELELGSQAERADGQWAVGPAVTFSIPLFDQGQARLMDARSRLRQQIQQYTALAVEIRAASRASRDRMQSSRDRALFYRREVLPLRHQIVQETLLQYNAMQVGVFELLIAKQQEIDAGQQYIESLHAYWQARLEVEQLLSGRRANFDSPINQINTMSASLGAGREKGDH